MSDNQIVTFEIEGFVAAVTHESEEECRDGSGNRWFRFRSFAEVAIRYDRQSYAVKIPVPYEGIKPGQRLKITIEAIDQP